MVGVVRRECTVGDAREGGNEDVLHGMDYILVAQTLAVLTSRSLEIKTDTPCPTGEVIRLVKGVTLYPYTRK